jgi:hypothetical protein
MVFLRTIFLGFIIIFGLSGCKRPHPNPEILDPIYADLLAEVRAAENIIQSEEKEIEGLRTKIAALKPRDIMRASFGRELLSRERRVRSYSERRIYFETRAAQRKAHVQREYLLAFEKDEPWPNPADYQAYLATKKLQSVSRNWDDRVPKLTRHLKPQELDSDTQTKAEK